MGLMLDVASPGPKHTPLQVEGAPSLGKSCSQQFDWFKPQNTNFVPFPVFSSWYQLLQLQILNITHVSSSKGANSELVGGCMFLPAGTSIAEAELAEEYRNKKIL